MGQVSPLLTSPHQSSTSLWTRHVLQLLMHFLLEPSSLARIDVQRAFCTRVRTVSPRKAPRIRRVKRGALGGSASPRSFRPHAVILIICACGAEDWAETSSPRERTFRDVSHSRGTHRSSVEGNAMLACRPFFSS